LAGARPGEAEPAGASPESTNTTLVVVATNAKLSRERANLLARASHDGIAGTIRPAHTMWDGDVVFTLATGEVEADQRSLEELATQAVMEAIRRGVLLAETVRDFPSAREGEQP
jgi:L-aminopeptidase/D-esterase-like protein